MTIKKYTKPRENLFIISRTSTYDDKPCDEAFKMEVMSVDRRTVDDPKKIEYYGGGDDWWYLNGSNHRIENGQICRDIDYEEVYVINIDNITDIMNLIDKYGECIIGRNAGGFNTIEIYDDYRE